VGGTGVQTAAQGVHGRVFLCRFSLTGKGFEDRDYQRNFMIPNALFAVLFVTFFYGRQCSGVANSS